MLTRLRIDGGGSFCVREDGHLVFTDFDTKLVFDLDVDTGKAAPVVEEDRKIYFADFDCHGNWILAVREDHHAPTIAQITNTLVAIDSKTQRVHAISLEGEPDFVLYPRFSPDGNRICWIQLKFPSMRK